MPLYIRDEGVNALAERFAGVVGTTKTEAVKLALQTALDAAGARPTLAQRAAPLQERARQLGLRADGSDDKALMDELSGGL